jgi:hypothetical protein
MAGEMTVVWGTPKTLEANGASTTNNSISQADDADYSVTADGSDYPDARFVLAAAYTTAPTEGAAISLYARPLNIDSTNDAEAPEVNRPTYFVGNFIVNNVGSSTTQYMSLIAFDVPAEASYYIHNNGTGQTINAGWTLKVTPRTYKPAA